MIAPIMALKRITLVLSSSLNTEIMALIAWVRPETGFQEWIMVHPSQIPRIRDM
jgi:hypothetical protein